MFQLLEYYGRWQGFKGRVHQLPAWARLLLGLAALPGVVLICLSLLVFLVSLSALLLLTVPLYRFLTAVCGIRPGVVMPAGASGFGPAPEGMEENWVPSVAGKDWFPYFRFYGPQKPFFEKTWKLPDIELATGQ